MGGCITIKRRLHHRRQAVHAPGSGHHQPGEHLPTSSASLLTSRARLRFLAHLMKQRTDFIVGDGSPADQYLDVGSVIRGAGHEIAKSPTRSASFRNGEPS